MCLQIILNGVGYLIAGNTALYWTTVLASSYLDGHCLLFKTLSAYLLIYAYGNYL